MSSNNETDGLSEDQLNQKNVTIRDHYLKDKKSPKKDRKSKANSKRPATLTRRVTQWETLIGANLPKDRFHTDYVLVYKHEGPENGPPDPEVGPSEASDMREKFAKIMQDEGIEIEPERRDKYTYLRIHVPFWRLCKEAERCRLEMPIKGFETYQDEDLLSCLTDFADKYLKTDDEVDFASSPLQAEKLHLFENGDDPDKFFRPALRSFLAHLILIHLNMKKKEEGQEKKRKKSTDHHLGLLYMLHKKYYCDAFIIHDRTNNDKNAIDYMIRMRAQYGSQADIQMPKEGLGQNEEDTRADLNKSWSLIYKYQPLWKIRNYFGEKIALYFAWCGILITTLWIPMFFGLAVFFYGIYLSVLERQKNDPGWTNSTNNLLIQGFEPWLFHVSHMALGYEANDKFKVFMLAITAVSVVEDSIEIVKESFDNDITPYFALFISIWGTIFLEVWKRSNFTLAYEWDVDSFENSETDRPEFVGTVEIPDPVIIGEKSMHSPFYRQCIKFGVSVSVLLFMICLVFITTAAIILYRIVITIDYCSNWSPNLCLLASTIGSSLLNAVAILILGKIYDWLAVKLTEWENHRTQTQYNDALIIKQFAFQFANCYTSLFYIAFFRGNVFQTGIFGLGPNYRDTCGDKTESSCMTMLSFQVMILMLTKPIPKFLMDVILPVLINLWRKHLKHFFMRCWCCFRANKVDQGSTKLTVPSFLEREHQKKDLGDFTLSEFTEKVIVYGFLMLFAASFPLAPLLAFFILLVDIRVDAKRMLWLYRRPVADIAQDIGMWYEILQFLNMIGVVSNACLIAFTSKWGNGYDITEKLIIIIAFEHIVFAIKFIIAACIPDMPTWVKLAIKRERYQIRMILDRDMDAAVSLLVHTKPTFMQKIGALTESEEDESSRERTPENLDRIATDGARTKEDTQANKSDSSLRHRGTNLSQGDDQQGTTDKGIKLFDRIIIDPNMAKKDIELTAFHEIESAI